MYKKPISGSYYYYMSVRVNGKITTFYLGHDQEQAAEKEARLRNELGIGHRGRPHREEENPRFVHHLPEQEMKSQARPLILIPVIIILCTAFLLRAQTTGDLLNLTDNLSQNLSDFVNGSFEPPGNLSVNESASIMANASDIIPANGTIPQPNPTDVFIPDVGSSLPQDIQASSEQAVLNQVSSELESGLGIDVRSIVKDGDTHDMEFVVGDSDVVLKGVNPADLKEAVQESIPEAVIGNETTQLGTDTIFLNSLPIESADITLQKTGPVNAILRCTNYSGSDCLEWVPTDIPFTDNGDSITFTVTGFSGYAGAYITILNVQSYPTVGDEWTVAFNTSGSADLTISASNGTEYGKDLEWLSLRCGNQTLQPDFDGSHIFYPNWSCSDIGYQTVKVLTGGPHTQRFDFGDDTEYAHNFATFNCSTCASCTSYLINGSMAAGDVLQLTASISNQVGDCISFGGADNVTFDCLGNTIDGDGTGSDLGISLNDSGGGSNYSTVMNCKVTRFQYGVFLSYSNFNTLNNIVTNSSPWSGTYLYYSNNNTLVNITTDSNGGAGFYLVHAQYNTINNSRAENNTQGGVYFAISNLGNLFYNSIFNNSVNVWSDGTFPLTYWNVTKDCSRLNIMGGPCIGGNYWTNSTANNFSDTCADSNKDGICDSSYAQMTNNTDYLALTKGVYGCISCSDCSSKIASASSGETVTLIANLSNQVDSCIAFNGKDNVTFDCLGSTIGGDSSGSDYGIDLSWGNTDNNTIRNCVVSGFQMGIYASGSFGNWIVNNTLVSNGLYGIDISNGGRNLLENNTAYSNFGEIFLYSTQNNTVKDNNVSNKGFVVDASSSAGCNNIFTGNKAGAGGDVFLYNNTHDITIKDNASLGQIMLCGVSNSTISNITMAGQAGIYIKGGVNITVSNSTITGAYNGIRIDGWQITSALNTISSCNLSANSIDGLYLYYTNNNSFSNITAYYDFVGIYAYGSLYNNLSVLALNYNARGLEVGSSSDNNTASNITANSNTQNGILISSSNYNALSSSNASMNANEGVYLQSSSSNNALSNVMAILNQDSGIYVSSSNNNTFDSITSSSNKYEGIYLISSSYNVVKNSLASNNSQYGVTVYTSTYNTFYNNILNNTVNFYSNSINNSNYWNTTKAADPNIIGKSWLGGNYWTYPNGTGFSDTCVDGDGDFICDSSYSLDGNNTDYLPLRTAAPQVYNCTSCSDCNARIASASSGDIVQLNTSLANQNVTGTCISFGGKDGVTLDCLGNTIDGDDSGTDYGIWLNDSSGGSNSNTIKNCMVTDFYTGLYLQSSPNNTLQNITSNSNTYTGFSILTNSNYNTLQNMTANSNTWAGLYINTGYNTLSSIIANSNGRGFEIDNNYNNLTNITASSNLMGLIMGFSNNTLRSVNITTSSWIQGLFGDNGGDIDNSVTVNGKPVQYFDGYYKACPNNQVLDYNNTYSQVTFVGCLNVTLNATDMIDSVYLIRTNNSRIYNAISTNNYDKGLYLSYSYNNILQNITTNHISSHGIWLGFSYNNTLQNITTNYDGYDGIYLGASYNNTLRSITSKFHNDYGLWVSSSSSNTFENITTSSDGYGLWMESGSSNNTIKSSSIQGNTQYGVYLVSSGSNHPSYNTFYNNVFNNTANFYSDNSSNLNYWNVTKAAGTNIVGKGWLGGNYWGYPNGSGFSDTCADNDGDFLCDSSYSPDGNNTDYLPLKSGPRTYNCTSCSDCNAQIASASYGDTIQLNTSISNYASGTCISFGGKDGVTFDCLENTIDGDDSGTDYGIWLNDSNGGSNDSTVRNCKITDFYNGLYMTLSYNNTLQGINASSNTNVGLYMESNSYNNFSSITANSNSAHGILLTSSTYDTFQNITTNSNAQYGLEFSAWNYYNNIQDIISNSNGNGVMFYYSSNNTLQNVTAQENTGSDIDFLFPTLDWLCSNTINNITGSGNRPIKFFNSSVNLSNETLSELILCNADNSVIYNVTIIGSSASRNNALMLYRTDYSNLTLINSSYRYFGLAVFYSSYNIIKDSIFQDSYIDDVSPRANSDAECPNTFTNVTGSGSYPIRYLSSSINLSNQTLSELILCNADNSSISNITIAGSSLKINGVRILRTDYSNLTNVNSSYRYTGLGMSYSFRNAFQNITTNYNTYNGLDISSSDYNTFQNITSNSNGWYGISDTYSNMNAFSSVNISSNSNNGAYVVTSSNSTFYNISNYNGGFIYLLSSSNYNTISGLNSYSNGGGPGLFIQSSNYNTINNSRIFTQSNNISVLIVGSAYNLFFNNIFNNSINVNSNSADNLNYWNTTYNCSAGPNIIGYACIGGNYWTSPGGGNFSDGCVDSNNDKVCDSTYTAAINNTDYLPLRMPATLNCINCSDCNAKIANASTDDIIRLNTSISNYASGTCISFGGKDNVTFECLGNTISGNGSTSIGYGIWLNDSGGGSNNDTVRNCTVNGFLIGLRFDSSSSNTIQSVNTSSNTWSGLHLSTSSNNTFQNITANYNNAYGGFYLCSSTNNTLMNVTLSHDNIGVELDCNSNYNTLDSIIADSNTAGIYLHSTTYSTFKNIMARENSGADISLYPGSDSQCVNNFSNITVSGAYPFGYYNSAVNLSNQTFSELILCNADISSLSNITIIGSSSIKNNGLIVWRTDNSDFTNINSSYRSSGLSMSNSNNNMLQNITANHNNDVGIGLFSNSNTLSNISSSWNGNQGIMIGSGSSNTLQSVNSSYNSYGIYIKSNSNQNNLSDISITSSINYGIWIETSNNNTIRNSRIEKTGNAEGIHIITGSIYNTFYNNYLNNSVNLYSDSPNNLNYWNTTYNCSAGPNIIGYACIGGNYWTSPGGGNFSDGCVDSNNDKVCDSTYAPATNNTDYLPLRMPVTLTCINCSDCNARIDAASPGDTIQLNTSITNQSGTCISFGGKDSLTFDCLGNTINGTGSGDGIWLNDSNGGSQGNTVKNCIVKNFTFGFLLDYASDLNSILNVTASYNNNGIYLNSASNNTIRNASATWNIQAGVSMAYSSYSTLDNVNASDNGYFDVDVTSSSVSQCSNNFTNVKITGNNPLLYYNAPVSITNQQIPELLMLCNADNSTISNVTMTSSSGRKSNGIKACMTDHSSFTNINSSYRFYGLSFSYSSDNNTISNITASYSNYGGIYVGSCTGNSISNIIVNSDSNYGIELEGSPGNALSNVTANSNGGSGVWIRASSNSTVSNAIVNSNVYGLSIHDSSYSSVSNISATSNSYGIGFISNSNYNTVNDSRTQGSTYGVYLESSGSNIPKYNTLYNSYLNNTVNFYSNNDSNLNYWNVSLNCSRGPNIVGGPCIGGNYWTNSTMNNFSDTCMDSDLDGFCDSGYLPGINNTDYLPLAKRVSTNASYYKASQTYGNLGTVNVTGYYYRNDTNQTIQGNITITLTAVSNSSLAKMKYCTGSGSCERQFSFGPGGDLPAGNYTISVSAGNSSANGYNASVSFFSYLEEAGTSGTLVPNPRTSQIADLGSDDYSFLTNLTLQNLVNGTMSAPDIQMESGLADFRSIVNLTSCPASIAPNSSCVKVFNVTVAGGTSEGSYNIGWNATWLNNNGSSGYLSNQSTVQIVGNANMTLSPANVTAGSGLGQPNVTTVSIQNNGNVNLDNVHVALASGNIPSSWVSFYSPNGKWNDGTDTWSFLAKGEPTTFLVNVTVGNYSTANYSGIVNVTSEYLGSVSVYLLVYVNVIVSPNVSLSASAFNVTQNISSGNYTFIYVNSTGNSPVTNVTVGFVTGSLPASWIVYNSSDAAWNNGAKRWSSISEQTGKKLDIYTTPTDFTEGLYQGTMNVTTAEGFSRTFNISIFINPVLGATVNLNAQVIHGTGGYAYMILNSTGNAKLLNITLNYVNQTLPAAWLNFTASQGNITEGQSRNVSILVTVPWHQSPGNYTGYFNVTSGNEPSRIINMTVDVPRDASWSLSPLTNQTGSFELNQPGIAGNFTINNSGNVPLNFSIQYIVSGSDPITENKNLNGTIMNPDSASVPAGQTFAFSAYQDGMASPQTNKEVKVEIANGTASPALRDAWIYFNVTDRNPSVESVWTEVSGAARNYVEINNPISLNATASDDNGLNHTRMLFNVTRPGGSYGTYLRTYESNLWPQFGERYTFGYVYANTSVAGIYNLTLYAEDTGGKPNVSSVYQFTVIGATGMSVTAGTAQADNITQYHGQNVTVYVNSTNTGSVNAYYARINTSIGGWWSENKTLGNLSTSQSNYTSIIVSVPAGIGPGSYSLAVNLSWQNPDGTAGYAVTNATVTVLSNQEFELIPSSTSTTVNHGTSSNVIFIVNATGNDNVTYSIDITPNDLPSNITVAFNNSGGVAHIGSPITVNMNISIDYGASSTTRSYTVAATSTTHSRQFQMDVFTPVNTSWRMSMQNITINSVSGQNELNTGISIIHTGTSGTTLNYQLSLAGNVSSSGIMNLLETSKQLSTGAYSVRLNYTGPPENSYYYGLLTINESNYGGSATVDVYFHSYVFELTIANISAAAKTLQGDSINVSAYLVYGEDNITDNTTYSVSINGTDCPVSGASVQGNITTITCTAPPMTDGRSYDIETSANYTSPAIGTVVVRKTSANALYYRDITAPQITYAGVSTPIETYHNVSFNATAVDNVQVESVIAEITYPNASAENITLHNYTASNFSAQKSFSGFGFYSVRYYAIDTQGLVVASASLPFEVYEYGSFQGTLESADLIPVPIQATFRILEANTTQLVQSFSTNASGFYNASIRKRPYDMSMDTLNATVNTSLNFAYQPSGFISIDPLTVSDVDLTNKVRGIAFTSNMTGSGRMSMWFDKSYADSHGLTISYLRLFRCASWSVNPPQCISGWLSMSNQSVDGINDIVKADFSSFSAGYGTWVAYAIAESTPQQIPEMTIPDTEKYITINNSETKTLLLEVQSTGTGDLQDITTECSSGTACTNFTVAAAKISVLAATQSIFIPVNITVPAGYPPTNGSYYDGTLTIRSNSYPYEQVKLVHMHVSVPSDSSWSSANTFSAVAGGGMNTGTLGYLYISNTGNLDSTFNITGGNGIESNQSSIAVGKQGTGAVKVNYTLPKSVGNYTYYVNITGPARIQQVAINFSVGFAINITSVDPTQSLEYDQMMRMNVTAFNSTAEVKSNITWSVTVGGTACINLTSAYSGSVWQVQCRAPNLTTQLAYELVMEAISESNATAFDRAYDNFNIFYNDIFPPVINGQTASAQSSGSNVTIQVNITDYSNLSLYTVNITYPISGNSYTYTLSPIGNNFFNLSLNLSEIGDYTLNYTLMDAKNNTASVQRFFEVYQYLPQLAGNVETSNGSGANVTFMFYRPEYNFSADQLLYSYSAGSGTYNMTQLHERMYDLEIDAFGNKLRFYDVNSTALPQDPIDLDQVQLYKVGIENAKDIAGIAAVSNISNPGEIVLAYNPSDANNIKNLYIYKCADWNYSEMECAGNWTVMNVISRTYNSITAQISSFSAYVVAETQLEIAPGSIINNYYQAGSSSSGSSSASTSTYIPPSTTVIQPPATTGKLVSDSQSIILDMMPGEYTEVTIPVTNTMGQAADISGSATGRTKDFISFTKQTVRLNAGEDGEIEVRILVPKDITPGLYFGQIKVTAGNRSDSVPVNIRVLESRQGLLDLKIEPVFTSIAPGQPVRLETSIFNLGETKRVDVQLILQLIDPNTDDVIKSTEESMAVETSLTSIKSIPTDAGMPEGKYIVKAIAYYTAQNVTMEASSVNYVNIEIPWYSRSMMGFIPLWMLGAAAAVAMGSFVGMRRYAASKAKKSRYKEKIELGTLPQPGGRSAFVGKVAETGIRTFMELDRLQTHSLIAGSTGSGKTISSQVIIEEALKKGVSVIVFDPTAQWTGFLRKCTDKRMLNRFGDFEMKDTDATGFPGNIHTIKDGHQLIDIRKYMIPGEINVFCTNELDSAGMDVFVVNTIQQIFRARLEESHMLKTIIVYDEVHRLLPKFGGSGTGFIQLERGVREFRKWGIGLMLISQVLSDFVGEIKANIGTEIQMRTTYEDDLKRIEMKYGEDLMKSLVKAGIGTGMVVNSEYNKGRPYFVSFRPILHNTSRLSDSELDNYAKYNRIIDELEFKIGALKSEGNEMFDSELELKLAKDKLKEGAFNMVDIYLETLNPAIDELWKKLKKKPSKPGSEFMTEEELKLSVKEAEKSRIEYVKTQEKSQKKPAPEKPGSAAGKAKTKEYDSLGSDAKKLRERIRAMKVAGKDVSMPEMEINLLDADISGIDGSDRKKITAIRDKLIKIGKELDSA